jgi:hypothetical protein
MTRLIPEKLHVTFLPGTGLDSLETPRYYTLTHSDTTGDLFLSIGSCYTKKQTSKLYTRFMRDEVLVELAKDLSQLVLNVYCHVSGGLVLGRAKWRYGIFCFQDSILKRSEKLAFFYHHSYRSLVVSCGWASNTFGVFIVGTNSALLPARCKFAFFEKYLQIKGLAQNWFYTLRRDCFRV